jgi:hypothetical protein
MNIQQNANDFINRFLNSRFTKIQEIYISDQKSLFNYQGYSLKTKHLQQTIAFVLIINKNDINNSLDFINQLALKQQLNNYLIVLQYHEHDNNQYQIYQKLKNQDINYLSTCNIKELLYLFNKILKAEGYKFTKSINNG